MLDIKELRKLGEKEMQKELATARMSMVQEKNLLKTNQDKKSHLARAYKTYIAQIHTINKENSKKVITSKKI